jgi:hypothetical protein
MKVLAGSEVEQMSVASQERCAILADTFPSERLSAEAAMAAAGSAK